MSREILIVGSGFAALQLVKALRKLDRTVPIRLLTADSGDDYNKPELSHVISQGRSAAELTRLTAGQLAEQHGIALVPHCRVTGIDPLAKRVSSSQGAFDYGQLVLATGASALLPPIPGREHLVTLNSQREYAAAERRLAEARRVLVLGAGLIGCELAADLARAGRQVILVDRADSILANLMPAAVSQPLQQNLLAQGIRLRLGHSVDRLEEGAGALSAWLDDDSRYDVDVAISAIGLGPNLELARNAGLAVGRGIQVDELLRSSDPHIFALGDCAEYQGCLRPYLQPTLLGANALARTLLGTPTQWMLPAMLVKVKTPLYPVELAGSTLGDDLSWNISLDRSGMTAKAFDSEQKLCGFVVGGKQAGNALRLLREVMSDQRTV